MSRTLALILIVLGWLLGLAASFGTILMFLFGCRMLFSGDVAIGLKVIGASLVIGWLLGIFKKFLGRSWASIPALVSPSSDFPNGN